MHPALVFQIFLNFRFERGQVRQNIPVGDHDSLGFGSCPRRENDLERIFDSHFHRVHFRIVAICFSDVLKNEVGNLLQRLRVFSGNDHDASIHLPRNPLRKFCLRAMVERNDYGAAQYASKKYSDPFRAVFSPDENSVALLNSTL